MALTTNDREALIDGMYGMAGLIRHEDTSDCGEAYDHDEVIVYEDETTIQWNCKRCGAEGWSDYDEEGNLID